MEIISSPVKIALLVFIGLALLIVNITYLTNLLSDEAFLKNLLVEAYGMLYDIVIIGAFVLWLNKRGEKLREIKHYNEEIDDLKHWKSDEAAHRIASIVKRLNKLGETDICLVLCHLKGADLSFVNLKGSNLKVANLQGVSLTGANLQNVDFRNADLTGADLLGANLRSANLKQVKGLTFGQLSDVGTLKDAELDDTHRMEIKKNFPCLLKIEHSGGIHISHLVMHRCKSPACPMNKQKPLS